MPREREGCLECGGPIARGAFCEGHAAVFYMPRKRAGELLLREAAAPTDDDGLDTQVDAVRAHLRERIATTD